MQQRCDNCLFEYSCNWEAAGEDACCPEWKPEWMSECMNRPLTPEPDMMLEIVAEYEFGYSMKQIGKRYDLKPGEVRKIIREYQSK